ncbi:PLP-dependent aminotransferase family protein [candidate division KSB1 bacterium]|nr:PLP-dependent aminotransferase family protein [candidate division KSB1 bacterium]
MQTLTSRLALRARGKQPSPIRELTRYLKIEGMISLGGGYPNPATFPFEKMELTFKGGKKVVIAGAELGQATQYGPSDFIPALKADLIGWQHSKDGVTLAENQLVTLNGSQEGLFIMAYLFLDADDWVVISEPDYPGAISAFGSFTKNFLAVPLDQDGMQVAALAKQLTAHFAQGLKAPKFIYTIPNGHNPGGVALSLARRQQLLDCAHEYDLLILEDDPYQLLQLDQAAALPTLQALDPDGRVIRLDSFSKILAPGIRLGYASGAAEIMQQFIYFKQSANLHTSSFIQMLLHGYLQINTFPEFQARIRENCQLYRQNRDAMLAAAARYLPTSVKYNRPSAGMFIWFELPAPCQAARMIQQSANDLKVVLVPGSAFSTQNGLANYMRASFSMVTPAEIDEGMRRFGMMLERELNRRD